MKRHKNISVNEETSMQNWGIRHTEKSRIFISSLLASKSLPQQSFSSLLSLLSPIFCFPAASQLFSSTLGLKVIAQMKIRVQEAAITLYVFLQPNESSRTCVIGPHTNIPRLAPMVKIPVANDRFLLKYFATIKKHDVRQKHAPSPVRIL